MRFKLINIGRGKVCREVEVKDFSSLRGLQKDVIVND
jgi:hypothetical protein